MHLETKVLIQYLHFVVLVDYALLECKPKSILKKPNVVHGRYTRDISDYHIVVPKKVHPNGSFHSHHLPHYFKSSVRKKRDLSDERIHYLLHFGGIVHLLELEPHPHLTSPGMVIEKRARGGDLSGVTFRGPQKHLCQFQGSVRGHPGSRVALSGCDGLVGLIRTNNGTFFVEPLHGESPAEGKVHVHVVYKRSTDLSGPSCNVREDWWSTWCARLRSMLDSKITNKRSEAGVSVPRYYETMVAADKKFLMHHQDHDVEEYIICIMNIVSDFYHDSSVGNMIDIVIVRIIYLEKEEEEIDLEISEDGEDTLMSFCKWQQKLNPKDHNHPNHHDVGVLLTRYDICSDDDGSGDTCSLMGLAHLGTACTESENCCINEDGGLILGVVTTHELGHTLSCTHDAPDESGCEAVAPAGDSTIMNPMVTTQTSAWSPCSRGFITGLFDSQLGECMLDEPKEHTHPLDDMPPGAFYDANEQCKFIFGNEFVNYATLKKPLCERLRCMKPGSNSCTTKNKPPAEGTSCGPDKWCYNLTCVEIGERPAATNGEWGPWGEWSECSRTCGGGVSMRERLCNNPQPSNKGRYCIGKRHDYEICNSKECDEKAPVFREAQCTEFNEKPYNGLLHTWTPYPAPASDPNPCALWCLSEDRVYTQLAPRVKDGTRCKKGTRDTCIQGVCFAVGCDWKVNSDAVEDVCGVCNGDGTHCTIVEEVFNGNYFKGYSPIVTIPAGALNIRASEEKGTSNMIAVSSFDNKTFYLNGGYAEMRPGEKDFGNNMVGMYTFSEPERDDLHIKGPIKEPLVLYLVFFDKTNPGVRYTYTVPTEKPMYEPKYHWEFVEWGPCSAVCGGGTQVMVLACIEERDGKVKSSFCDKIPKEEEARARSCNDQPCRTRWKVWKWGPCSGCVFQSGIRTREVECVKEHPTLSGDEEIITDPSECCGEPPPKSELCNSPRPCPKNMTSEIVKRDTIEVIPIEPVVFKRASNEGKSFNDGANTTTETKAIKDPIFPQSEQLDVVLLEDNKINLTEKEFVELGEDIPDQVLSCPLEKLTGKEAMHRMEELIHGEGYHRNVTKLHHNKTHSSTHSTTKIPTSTTKNSTGDKGGQDLLSKTCKK